MKGFNSELKMCRYLQKEMKAGDDRMEKMRRGVTCPCPFPTLQFEVETAEEVFMRCGFCWR